MPVTVSMPCPGRRWRLPVLGVLGDDHTCSLRNPAGTYPASARLFLRRGSCVLLWLITGHEPLTDFEAGVAVGVPSHLAVWTVYQGRTHGIACLGVPTLRVPDDLRATSGTLPAGVARIDATRDDVLIPGFIFGVPEDAALHPVGAFLIAATAILALLRFEVAKVLEYQNAGSVSFGKLDNSAADAMGLIVVTMPDLLPEVGIILLALDNDARLAAVACNPPERTLPKAGYRIATANESGGEDRTFGALDGTHSDLFP